MLAEGSSIRSIERVTGIHRDTIMRLGIVTGSGSDNAWYAFWAVMVALIVAWASREIANAIFDIADCALKRAVEAEKENPVQN
jgi:hypothetical protein